MTRHTAVTASPSHAALGAFLGTSQIYGARKVCELSQTEPN
jgi:hypothetical protein